MREVLKLAGYAGAVLLLFGILSFALSGTFDLWTAVHVAGGGILAISGLAANLAGVQRTVARRGTRERAQAGIGIALFVAILAGANVLAARYPKSWDATEQKIYTLSERTRAVLSGLTAPVELVGFYPPADRARPAIEDLLRRYAGASARVTYRFVDPETDPALASQFGITRQGVLAARSGSETARAEGGAEGTIEEGEVTSLILKVARPERKRVYALTGHGEPALDDLDDPRGWAAVARALGEENVEIKPLLLATAEKVPDDAGLVAVAGPVKPLLPHEIDALRTYLAGGGRVLLLIDPDRGGELAPLLADYRIGLDDTMIVDQQEVPFLGARLGLDPLVDDFPPHPITKSFHERIVLSQARSLTVLTDGGLAGVVTRPLAQSGPASWGERGWRDMLRTGRVEKNDDDASGPLLVAAAASAPIASTQGKEARLAVVGDSDWTANGNLEAFFNRDLFMNVVRWLLGSEDLIVGPPKQLRASRLDMTVADQRNLFRFGVLLLPEVLLIGGLLAWRRRKSL